MSEVLTTPSEKDLEEQEDMAHASKIRELDEKIEGLQEELQRLEGMKRESAAADIKSLEGERELLEEDYARKLAKEK